MELRIGILDRPLDEIEIERDGAGAGADRGGNDFGLQPPVDRQHEGIGLERLAGDGDDGEAWMRRRLAIGKQGGAPVGRPMLELQERGRDGRNEEETDDAQQRGQAKGRGMPGHGPRADLSL
jgi:hypothetical protein